MQHLVQLILSRYSLVAQTLNMLIISNSIQYTCCSLNNILWNTYMNNVVSNVRKLIPLLNS